MASSSPGDEATETTAQSSRLPIHPRHVEMYRYSGFSLQIHSQLELPEFPPGAGEADVAIRLGEVRGTDALATIDDEKVFSERAGAFHIRKGREFIVDLLPDAHFGSVRTLLAGRFFCFLLCLCGFLVLLVCVVVVGGFVV